MKLPQILRKLEGKIIENHQMKKVFLLLTVSLTLMVFSLFIPWIYVTVEIDEVKGADIDADYEMNDRLYSREESYTFEYRWIHQGDEDKSDNSDVGEDYPDTAFSKNLTLGLMVILMILCQYEELFDTSKLKKHIMCVAIFSIVVVGQFSILNGPYDGENGDEDDDGDEDSDFTIEENGNLFQREVEFHGDVEGSGEGRVSIGYVIFWIGAIMLFISLYLVRRILNNERPIPVSERRVKAPEL